MKIALCLYHYFPYGGQQRVMLAIAQMLKEAGHAVHIFTTKWQGDQPEGLMIHIAEINALGNHKKMLLFSRVVQHETQKEQFDIVVGFNKLPGLDIYFAADEPFKSKKGRGRFYKRFLNRYKIFNRLEKSVFSKKSKTQILCLCEQQKQHYQALYHTQDERITVLPPDLPVGSKSKLNNNDRSAIRQALKIPKNDFVLITVASSFKTKGVDRALKALASLKPSTQTQCHYLIIGGDDSKSIRTLAQGLKLQQKVHFLGAQADITPYLLASDIMIHPARAEAGGIVLIEAIAAGLAILSTEICGYARIVKEAQAGKILQAYFSQDTLDQALSTLLDRRVIDTYRQHAKAYADKLEEGAMVKKAVRMITNPEQRA